MNKQKTILKLMDNVVFLKKNTIFSGLSTEEIKAIAAISKEIEVEDNVCIVEENSFGNSMFIIKTGKLKIIKGQGKNKIELAELNKNESFGEIVLFEEESLRTASVFASGKCILLCIERDEFLEQIMYHPKIAIELLKSFGQRLRKTNDKLFNLTKSKN